MSSCEPCDPLSEPGAFASRCFFSRGPGTFRVPLSLHADNRAKLVAAMRAAAISAVGAAPSTGIVLLRGGVSRTRDDTDHEELFRQESYFNYLFGVAEPDWWGMIELGSGRATLFMPRLDAAYAVWMGEILSCEHYRARYGVDAVRYVDELEGALAETFGPIHVMKGKNSDSGLDLADALPITETEVAAAAAARRVDRVLYEVLAECRAGKSPAELELMRYVSWVSSEAHVAVMRDAKPGMMEYQLEARFLFHIADAGGCRHCAYTCICACGPNAAVLHYGHAGAPNDRRLLATDIGLLDMGAEYHCYASDITCSYPIGGSFTADQRLIFGAVLDAQVAVIGAMRPGVSWVEMHTLAWRAVLSALRGGGVVKGDVDEMVAAGLGAVFMPHGLGHLIGLDTHDVGGYLSKDPPRPAARGLSKLRTARVLAAGQVLTVEPGCYFIDALLDPALADAATARFLDEGVLKRFRGFGGVRLEDVVAVTDDGVDNYTLCPRTVEEIEGVMAGGAWPPKADAAPGLRRRWATLDKATGAMVATEL